MRFLVSIGQSTGLLLAFAMSGALTAQADPTTAVQKCALIADYNGMVACFATSAGEADREVDRLFQALLERIAAGKQRELLSASQTAWLSYRSAYCAFA